MIRSKKNKFKKYYDQKSIHKIFSVRFTMLKWGQRNQFLKEPGIPTHYLKKYPNINYHWVLYHPRYPRLVIALWVLIANQSLIFQSLSIRSLSFLSLSFLGLSFFKFDLTKFVLSVCPFEVWDFEVHLFELITQNGF